MFTTPSSLRDQNRWNPEGENIGVKHKWEEKSNGGRTAELFLLIKKDSHKKR